MFGDGEGLHTEVKFAVAATYDKFAAKWGVTGDKLRWVDDWASFLSRFSVAEINSVADYCVIEFRRPPVPVEYIELCTRVRNGKQLSEPMVSKLERMPNCGDHCVYQCVCRNPAEHEYRLRH